VSARWRCLDAECGPGPRSGVPGASMSTMHGRSDAGPGHCHQCQAAGCRCCRARRGQGRQGRHPGTKTGDHEVRSVLVQAAVGESVEILPARPSSRPLPRPRKSARRQGMWWLAAAFGVAVNFPAFSPSQARQGGARAAARLSGVASRPRYGGLTDVGDHHDYRKISERRKRPDHWRA
jgi:hypothetical protein